MKRITSRPSIFAWVDLGAFVGVFLLGLYGLENAAIPVGSLSSIFTSAVPFLPLFAVATVLVGGVMFELTTTARFAGSDAANWLPLRPEEYVLASSSAIAYTYSPGAAVLLGAFAALGVYLGATSLLALTAALMVVGLFEGAFLVEMVRSTTQRAGASSARRGRVTLVLRAVLLVCVIVLLQLAFNPVFLFASLRGLAVFGQLTAFLPPFWGTYALLASLGAAPGLAAAFALGQVGFAGLLLVLAARLRVRFWSVDAEEFRLEPHRYAAPHRFLRGLGLTPQEAAVVTKDFHGYVRRREMLPMLVLPIVLLVVVFLETTVSGSSLGSLGTVVFAGWAVGFFALLLSTVSVGQERKAFWVLYAAPMPAGSVFRAKLAATLAPAWVSGLVVAALVAGIFHLSGFVAGGLALTSLLTSAAVALWGLGFAARYSDFQERPRPQYVRPGAMLGATAGGMVIIFVVVIPAALAILSSGTAALSAGAVAAALGFGAVGLGWGWARTGFQQLWQELPF